MTEQPHVIKATIANVKTTKKDGNLLMTKKGVPFVVVGIKDEAGGWLNLTAFDTAFHPMLFQGARVKIAYTEEMRTNGFGEPELYNGAPQWNRNIIAVRSLDGAGAPQSPQNGAASANATPPQGNANFERDKNESIRSQTALKVAGEMYAAHLGANKAFKWEFDEFERIYRGTKQVLDGVTNELDATMETAKEVAKAAGMEEVVDMPGPDAAPLPVDEAGDNFPF